MNPEVNEFITHAAWCRSAVEKIVGMLPMDDAELDSWIGETTREFNSLT